MTADDALVAELEAAAAPALPAHHTADVHGWLVRCSLGQLGRANTVLPLRFGGGSDQIGAAVDEVEHLARAAGIVPGFQMSAAAQPPGLDAVLGARGYQRTDGALVMTLPLAGWAPPAPAPGLTVLESPAVDTAWLDVHDAGTSDTPARRAELEGCLTRITAPARYVRITNFAGADLGVGRGVLSGRWLGIMSMATLPAARRRGVARVVLDRLAAWATGEGATDAYLQVAPDNAPAIALYRSVGFTTAYEYWRRVLPPV